MPRKLLQHSGDGRRRVFITRVSPEIEAGRYPIKRVVGDTVTVEADILADGHDKLCAVLRYRRVGNKRWQEAVMKPLGNDRWQGRFSVPELGRYEYALAAWVDHFGTWRQDFIKRCEAGQELPIDLEIGVNWLAEIATRATGEDKKSLAEIVSRFRKSADQAENVDLIISKAVLELAARHPERRFVTEYGKHLPVWVERERARYSAWYELFPRSWGQGKQHGSFRDVIRRLPYVKDLGFDVLYLPPIHPIGLTERKGKNHCLAAGPTDPGSPWAIGNDRGGHKAIHAALGSLTDFEALLTAAKDHGLEIALDLALQCSPDHPYVKQHPEWFRMRPDGTIQFAENPPKKYQDIYPFDFETEHWQELWEELKTIVLYWIEQGVRIFRVDNPHTKPFCFWEWLLPDIKRSYPDVIFLAEAFTRPKIMYQLAKLGFTQSYTYFAWRNTKSELTDYLTELTQTDVRDYFGANLWPNTPDILHEYLQQGGRPAFMIRLILAATLSAAYGIYGPAFELCINAPREKGSEEYLNAEKYEIKAWNFEHTQGIGSLIAGVNRIRRENRALHYNQLRFHDIDNDQLICYSKQTEDMSNVILVIVSLDYANKQSGWTHLALEEWGFNPQDRFIVHDLLNDSSYRWQGERNYVELDPQKMPAHIFRIERV